MTVMEAGEWPRPSLKYFTDTEWAHTAEIYTDTPNVDTAPITHYEESSSEVHACIPFHIPPVDSDIDMEKFAQPRRPTWFSSPNGCFIFDSKVEESKDFEPHFPANGYYDSGPWWDRAYESDEFDDAEPGDDDISSFDGDHADVKKGGGFECYLPGPEYHDDPVSSDGINLSYYGADGIDDAFIDYFNSAGAIEIGLLTPSTDTALDAEDGMPPCTYDPQTGRRLWDYPGAQDHCEGLEPWVSDDSEDPYTEFCDTYKQGVPFLTASSNRGASSRLPTSSRSETAQVCSLILLLLIILLTLSFLNNYLYHRTLAALRRRREQENDSSSGSKGKLSQAEPQAEAYHAKFHANADHEDHENSLKHLASSFFVTLGHLFCALLFLSTTRDRDDAVQDACIILGTARFIWLGMNTVAVFNVIRYERPAWAIPILDRTNAFFNAVGKLFGHGYAKISNAFLSVAWHLSFALMLMAFTILLLADATMKSLSGSPDKKSTSKQVLDAASEKQGKVHENVEAEPSTKLQPETVWVKEKAVIFEEVPKNNSWLKGVEEERAKAESVARALEQSSKEPKVEPASGLDEWEMIEK